jgi:hypothetical protein
VSIAVGLRSIFRASLKDRNYIAKRILRKNPTAHVAFLRNTRRVRKILTAVGADY